MVSLLEGLKRHTTIVADTGDLRAIERLRPRDATTNPSLIPKAAQAEAYRPLVQSALREAADEPVAEGIRAFAADTQRLEAMVATLH